LLPLVLRSVRCRGGCRRLHQRLMRAFSSAVTSSCADRQCASANSPQSTARTCWSPSSSRDFRIRARHARVHDDVSCALRAE
jgi:hypothetical protein